MALAPGTRLGRYETLALLGTGGMGEVYKARDTRLDRLVAITVLPARLSLDPGHRLRLEREARTIASLNHPHICSLHDGGHHDGADFLVMEFLDGETLAARIGRGSNRTALPVDEMLRVAVGLSDALVTAHATGIVHRDLKPANVMLTSTGVKVLDFGVAKLAHTPAIEPDAATVAKDTLTGVGTAVGTVAYMAPEGMGRRA